MVHGLEVRLLILQDSLVRTGWFRSRDWWTFAALSYILGAVVREMDKNIWTSTHITFMAAHNSLISLCSLRKVTSP